MSALAMSANLKNKVSSLINREMSLAMSSSSFSPRFVEHVPGVFNYSPDVLSRKKDPSLRGDAALGLPSKLQWCLRFVYGPITSPYREVPPYLPSQLRVQLTVRAHGYYRTLTRHGR